MQNQLASPMITTQLGEKIKKIRVAQGLSQRKLAKMASLSNDYISKIELGHAVNVGLQTLDKISKALGISAVDLQVSLKVASTKSPSILRVLPTDDKTRRLMSHWVSLVPTQRSTVLDYMKKLRTGQ